MIDPKFSRFISLQIQSPNKLQSANKFLIPQPSLTNWNSIKNFSYQFHNYKESSQLASIIERNQGCTINKPSKQDKMAKTKKNCYLLIPLHIQTRKSLKYYHFLPLLTLTNPTFLTLIISKHSVAKKEAKCTLKSDYPRMERNILILQQL